MKISPAYAKVPFIQQKISYLSKQIHSQRESVSEIAAWGQNNELFFAARADLRNYEKLWHKVTGGALCN